MTYEKAASVILNVWNEYQDWDTPPQGEIIGDSGFDIAMRMAYDALIEKENLEKLIDNLCEERKTGRWVKSHGWCTPGGDPVWECSECGKGRHVYGIEHGTYGADVADQQWVACPNCGVLMEE